MLVQLLEEKKQHYTGYYQPFSCQFLAEECAQFVTNTTLDKLLFGVFT